MSLLAGQHTAVAVRCSTQQGVATPIRRQREADRTISRTAHSTQVVSLLVISLLAGQHTTVAADAAQEAAAAWQQHSIQPAGCSITFHYIA
jgi:hypothetical protein